MMKHIAILLSITLVVSCRTPPRDSDDKPNVIIIFTDDQGTLDAGSYGSEDLVTPGIDGLAERGVRFSQFYAAAPVCSPSRAGLLTGRYPARAGMPGNAGSEKGRAGMPASEVTIAEMMKSAGYATAHVGKWHLGYTPETMPNGQGFDYSFGHMGGCIDNFSHFFYWNGPNRHDLWQNGEEIYRDSEFFPDLMVEEANAFMETHRDEPFFLYFAMNAPHYPYQGEEEWLEYYNDVPYPRNLYAAFLTTLDARIAQLVDKVDELGLRENTLIIFQSDHGHSMEVRAHNGGGNAGPYRGAKFSLFEGGIRVPAIVSMPGTIPEGDVRDQMAHGSDWFPTIAEIADVPLLNDDLDGKSLKVVIEDNAAPSPHETLYWHLGRNNPYWAVRHGDWKLLGNPRDSGNEESITEADSLFLTNLKEDRGESRNLIEEYPEVAQQLKALHKTWVETSLP